LLYFPLSLRRNTAFTKATLCILLICGARPLCFLHPIKIISQEKTLCWPRFDQVTIH
jgi:hypothetical protein